MPLTPEQEARELLELAAKAAGMVGTWATGHQAYGDEKFDGLDTGLRFLWNPLVSDGDALRLAVKLRMCIDIKPTESVHSDSVFVGFGGHTRGGGRTGRVGAKHADISTATRRAIVRAAAEIGKAAP